MGSHSSDYLDGTNAVGDSHNFVFVNPLLSGPDTPLPLHGAGGVYENSVEIEEDG